MSTPIVVVVMLILLFFQAFFVIYTLRQNISLKSILWDDNSKYKKQIYYIPKGENKHLSWEKIKNKKEYTSESNETNRIDLIKISPRNKNGEKIESNINDYLIQNIGNASNYDIIKDIVERNCSALTERVETLIPFPLYCGLLGTMLGVIIGVGTIVFFEGGFSEPDKFVAPLMKDIAVAMGVSAVGIVCTIVLSGMANRAKESLQRRKNCFYSWFQTEMLPEIYKESFDKNTDVFNKNLRNFNERFEENLAMMEAVFGRVNGTIQEIHNATEMHNNLLRTLQEIDFDGKAHNQLLVFQEFDKSLHTFEDCIKAMGLATLTYQEIEKRHNELSNALNVWNEKTKKLTDEAGKKLDDLGEGFEKLIDKVDDKSEETVKTIESKTDELVKKVEDTLEDREKTIKAGLEKNIYDQKEFIKQHTDKIPPAFSTVNELEGIVKGLSDWKQKLEAQTNAINALSSNTDTVSKNIDTMNGLIEKLADSRDDNIAVLKRNKIMRYGILSFGALILLLLGFNIAIMYNINKTTSKIMSQNIGTPAANAVQTADTAIKK